MFFLGDAQQGKEIVEGQNIMPRHERPKKSGQKGQKVQFPGAINISNLTIICPNCGKPTRAGSKIDDKSVKVRICKKCGKGIK